MESFPNPTISRIFHSSLTLAARIKTCFFCTEIRAGKAFKSRPMALKEIDEEGNIFFLSDRFSKKNAELSHDPMVQLIFVDHITSDFLSLSGKAKVFYDKHKIKELWDQQMNVWLSGTDSNPRISIIQVRPLWCQYWDQQRCCMKTFDFHKAGGEVDKLIGR